MEDEKHCSSFNIWMEYTKHGWVTAGLFRVRQMELGGKTKGVVNGTFQSKWKAWAENRSFFKEIGGFSNCYTKFAMTRPLVGTDLKILSLT